MGFHRGELDNGFTVFAALPVLLMWPFLSERHKVNGHCRLDRVGADLLVEAGVIKAHAEVP